MINHRKYLIHQVIEKCRINVKLTVLVVININRLILLIRLID